MGLLRTILIIALVYYGFKVLARIFSPLILKYAVKKANQNFGGKQRPESKGKTGETIIGEIPKTKKSNKNVGEYVDYEEVD